MRAKGNGDVSVCANNLLAIVRGEVPYDRIRGIGTAPFDSPTDEAVSELEQDALWALETYEPRAEVQAIEITQKVAENGNFELKAIIT